MELNKVDKCKFCFVQQSLAAWNVGQGQQTTLVLQCDGLKMYEISFQNFFSLWEMELSSWNKYGHVEQSVKLGQGQQMILVLRRRCHDERLW